MVGISAASLIEMAHSIRLARQQAKMRQDPTETDENTIVLTLPKRAEVMPENGKPTAAKTVESTKSGDYVVNRGKQSRHVKGQFGPNLSKAGAADGWPTLTASALAAIAGTAGGSMLVSKIVERQREKRMRSEMEAARQEYLDMLSGGAVKGASVVEDIFGGFEPEGEKQAGDTFGMLNYPLAAMAILTILGTGTTGYLTKRVLDEQFQATSKATKDIPKVKRIVFRSAPETDPSKMASAEECGVHAAGLLVMMDKVSGQYRATSMPYVKEALDKAGLTAEALVKQADDYDMLSETLSSNPDLAQALKRVYIDQTTTNPFARFFKRTVAAMPGFKQHGTSKLVAMIQGMRPGSAPAGAPQAKVAGVLPAINGLSGALIGGAVGTGMTGDRISKDELAAMIEAAQQKAQAQAQEKPEPDSVRVQATDPAAAAYVSKNSVKIKGILRRLAAEGQI